jgi:hypothetical protein
MTPLLARFRDPMCELFEQHGVKNVGYWTNGIGGRDDQLVYMVSFENLAQREEAWDSFAADPKWHEARAVSEADGRFVRYPRAGSSTRPTSRRCGRPSASALTPPTRAATR